MDLKILAPKKSLNKAYLKEKVSRNEIELIKQNLKILFSNLGRHGDEEHLKSQLTFFLRDTWYKEKHQINPIEKNDLAIHLGKSANDSVGVILEVKSISNTTEMISEAKPNVKALHELILYYLHERIDHENNAIKYLIATNIEEWFIFDANEFDKKIFRNPLIKKLYELKKSDNKDNPFFYAELRKLLLRNNIVIEVCHFNINKYKKVVKNTSTLDDALLIDLYKILSPTHLLKQSFANDSNSLDTRFYSELLYIIGLEEIKDGSRKIIHRMANSNNASLLENAIIKLKDRDSLSNVTNLSRYGSTEIEQYYQIGLELCITWINRILFLKLLEAQLIRYNKGDKEYLFLNTHLIFDFDELSNLFFQVLAERPGFRRPDLQNKFEKVPYLNSSLFERTLLERETIDIGSLDNRIPFTLYSNTVLKDSKGKRKTQALTTLQYLFEFLDAYDFTSEGGAAIQEENKNLINASVLGLIFEKINGYKDGSFFTPGFVTMYMCREAVRRAVIQRFNSIKGWNCNDFNDLYNHIKDKKEANEIVNGITICDPAVGSGHFLVSALNEMIAIKSELGILLDKDGRVLRDYDVEVVNDELIVTSDGELFEYNFRNKESQRIQETFFHEKEQIIEDCLFGVDLNPNSVKICRLRLWIELLKSAYYKPSVNGQLPQLETLPNLDINIKSGNSLLSRFALDADLKPALQKSKYNIDSYKLAVNCYKHAEEKVEKRDMEALINVIKNDFKKDVHLRDIRYKRLQKLRGELFSLTQTKELFDSSIKKSKDWKKNVDRLSKEIDKIEYEVDEIKTNKIYSNAFEWRLEFPEVLNTNGDFIGFDVIIGNPPYIQLQKLSEIDKTGLERQQFETYAASGDLYQLFYEQGIKLLKSNGILCYITSNKWMRTDYGKSSRAYFSTKCNTEFVVDFGMAQMFGSATTYTNILLLAKEVPTDSINMCRVRDDYDATIPLNEYVPQNFVEIETPGSSSWIAYNASEYELIKRIEKQGKPLQKWNILINRGVLTGCNEAFIIDTKTRDLLISEDPKSEEIIKPILRGEDIQAYLPKWADKWIIGTFPSLNLNITEYPAIERYLLKFKDRIEPKPKNFSGKWQGRKSGSYEWFETQDSISYYRDFLKPKIIYPNMTKFLPFVYDKHQFFTNQKCFIITGENLGYLTAFLNSRIFRFTFKDYFPELLGDTRELSKVFFEKITIKDVDARIERHFAMLIDNISELKSQKKVTIELEEKIECLLEDIYSLSAKEIELIRSCETPAESTTEQINLRSTSVSP